MSYDSEILSEAGLRAFWLLDTTSGTDVSVGGSLGPVDITPWNGVNQNYTTTLPFTGAGSAWSFDGVDDGGRLGGGGLINTLAICTVEYWLNWDAYGNDGDTAVMFGIGGSDFVVPSFLVEPNNSGGNFAVGLGLDFRQWTDSFTRPSAAAWHHYAIVFDRATPQNKVYVDKNLQTLTPIVHDVYAYGNFDDEDMCIMSHDLDHGAGAGKMSRLSFISGEVSSARIAAHYDAAGAGPPPPSSASTPALRLDFRSRERIRR